MRVVTPTDMRKRLGEILDAASAGERILIERDHKPLAWLVSPEDGRRFDDVEEARLKRSLAALDRLDEFSRRMAAEYAPPEDGLTEADWLRQEREGRMDRIDEAAQSLGHDLKK
jgi:PHD/YefM family antitoxin component YafN of YafNO toxin-antitoxin module